MADEQDCGDQNGEAGAAAASEEKPHSCSLAPLAKLTVSPAT